MLVFLYGVLLWGRYIVWFCALKDLTPVRNIVCCLSLSLFVCLVGSSATFFLFLFLSGAGETQTPFGVWVSPCDSSSWTRSTSSTRTPSSAPTPRLCPAPVFFIFFLFRRRSSFRLGCSWIGVVGLVFLVVGCLLVCFCMQWKMLVGRFKRGRETRHLPPHFLIAIVIVFFRGLRVGTDIPCVAQRGNTPNRSHPPHPLPAERCKAQPRKGVGVVSTATVLSHKFLPLFLVPPRGKCCPFFSFCVFRVWSGVFCHFLSFLLSKGRFWEKFSGANFCFWGVVLVWCFLVGFCYCFCFIFWRFAPETVWKNSIDVRSGFFWARSLFLRFFCKTSSFSVFFFRDIDQVVTGHPFTRTCLSGSFSFLCPAAFVCSARFGRASRFLAFFRGAILGPGRFWDSP